MKERFLNIFGITEHDLETVIGEALSQGGDWSDLYFENTEYNSLTLKDSIVSAGGFHIDYGVGIRVLEGDRTGYAYSESTRLADMLAAARAAGTIAGGRVRRAPVHTTREITLEKSFYPSKREWKDARPSEFIPFLTALEQKAKARESRITKVMARLSWSQTDILMYNSKGELTCDSRPVASLTATAIFTQDERSERKSVARSYRMGAEFVNMEMIDTLAVELTTGIDQKFDARRPKGGRMPVVMGAGASGILLHEAMGHAFEADFNRKGQSIFSDKLGKKVCSRKISIVDDGTIAANRGAGNFDDEGVIGQKTYMIEDGVLKSYLHDRISAAHYGVRPTGNGRRECFRFEPIPRMRATYMESGKAAPQDIIASVKQGIYVDEFANGQVKIGEGDFTFFVENGYLIENGRLTAPIKDINVIGNGPKALQDVVAVGNDLKIDPGTWTCGKGQSVAVSCGMPTVLVKSLIVGGE